jgi:hypothetical protein
MKRRVFAALAFLLALPVLPLSGGAAEDAAEQMRQMMEMQLKALEALTGPESPMNLPMLQQLMEQQQKEAEGIPQTLQQMHNAMNTPQVVGYDSGENEGWPEPDAFKPFRFSLKQPEGELLHSYTIPDSSNLRIRIARNVVLTPQEVVALGMDAQRWAEFKKQNEALYAELRALVEKAIGMPMEPVEGEDLQHKAYIQWKPWSYTVEPIGVNVKISLWDGNLSSHARTIRIDIYIAYGGLG